LVIKNINISVDSGGKDVLFNDFAENASDKAVAVQGTNFT
jgi:hypothetical protein